MKTIKITQHGRQLWSIISPHFKTQDGAAKLSECSALHRLARRHKTIQKHHCNGPVGGWTKQWEQDMEKMHRMCEAQIIRICATMLDTEGKCITVIFSGDPRGATVKLVLPSGFTNDWGQEGVCVLQD